MIDLRYIMGRMDALSECSVRLKSGDPCADCQTMLSVLAYCKEQIAMCQDAEKELLNKIEKEKENV